MKAPEALLQMLKRYELRSLQDYTNALTEIVQEIALLGLWRAKFFERAAFYGGTALRILYKLDRFSEDLDFSLLAPDPHFDLSEYEKAIQEELISLGFMASVEKKVKSKKGAIDSAFIKINTIQHLFHIEIPQGVTRNLHPDEKLKIRFEVDTDPPDDGARTENIVLYLPSPFSVKTLKIEDLFAGQMHATLCREWKGRVKGRDWYDFIWFVARGIRLNLFYLEQRMRQSGHWTSKSPMTHEDFIAIFDQKIANLNVEAAKEDVVHFLKDSSQIELWSKDFFRQAVRTVQCERYIPLPVERHPIGIDSKPRI